MSDDHLDSLKLQSAAREKRRIWNAAVKATDKIFRDTVRDALDTMDTEGFYLWIHGFVGKGEE